MKISMKQMKDRFKLPTKKTGTKRKLSLPWGKKSEHQYHERVSIKFKLISSHILLAILPVAIIAIALFGQAKASLMTKAENANMAYSNKVTSVLDMKLQQIEDVSKLIVTNQEMVEIFDRSPDDYENAFDRLHEREKFKEQVYSMQFSNSNILDMFIVKEDEIIESVSNHSDSDAFREAFLASDVYKLSLDIKNKPKWYYGLFDTQDLYFVRPVKSLTYGSNIGTLVIRIKSEHLLKELKMYDVAPTATLAVVDAQGSVIVSDGFQDLLVMEELNPLTAAVTRKVSEVVVGSFTTTKNVNEEMMVYYSKLINGWTYVIQVPTSAFVGDINRIGVFAIVLSAIIGLIAVVIGVWISFSLSKPIDQIKKEIKRMEQGDLRAHTNIIGKYEIGQLSSSFNAMTQNFKGLIQEVGLVVELVTHNANELNQISQNSAQASKEVMRAVESVSNGATEQAQDAEKTTNIVEQLVSKVSDTEKHFNSVVEVTTKTKEASERANIVMNELATTSQETVNLSKNIQGDIKGLVDQFAEISGIIDIIDSISDQTNLLALNAAIEAARAGDAGRGFAVVADEIRKLAQQSSGAVKNITEIIENIGRATDKTQQRIYESTTIVVKQEAAVGNTEAIFKEIMLNMDAIDDEVKLVYQMLEGLEAVQTQATDATTSIAAIAEETAAAIEEVLASGEEQSATSEHLVTMAMDLSMVIEEMSNKVKHFTY